MSERIVILSGAGISAESGIATFRDSNGLWERHSIEEVATPEGFARDPEKVLRFYNDRRNQLSKVEPNCAHRALAELERNYSVSIVTQNIDDLHERAGSSHVVHLHGELTKARSCIDQELIYNIGYESIKLGQKCELGSQLRPHVVWFGEDVPMIDPAMALVARADRILVVGTSLQVYPAAGLVDLARSGIPITVIDPSEAANVPGAEVIRKSAVKGVPDWVRALESN